MFRWEKYIHSIRDYVILVTLVLISFFLFMNNQQPQVRWIRSNVLNVLGTWQNAISSVYQYRTLKAENEILRNRIALLSFKNSLMKEAYLENDRLRKLLEFKRKSTFDLVPVSIIRRNYRGFSHAFVIDVGKEDGVDEDMPVVSSEGLVGKIVVSSYNSAVVHVLNDINFRVSAMIQRSRVTGIVQPDESLNLRMNYVPLRADVKPGDVVITSGYSELYPKGIEIGVVKNIEEPIAKLFKVIRITPSVDLMNLEEAFVVLN